MVAERCGVVGHWREFWGPGQWVPEKADKVGVEEERSSQIL